eukprot:1343896-Pyramimonas_sp.AAC.1
MSSAYARSVISGAMRRARRMRTSEMTAKSSGDSGQPCRTPEDSASHERAYPGGPPFSLQDVAQEVVRHAREGGLE